MSLVAASGTATSGIVGVLANPASGKDVRRLVAHASPTSDASKIGVVRRAVLGAIAGGAKRVLVAPDSHQISERAIADLELADEHATASVELLGEPVLGHRVDTVAMSQRFEREDASVVIALGGDGTMRDVVRGWPTVTLIALSTGTNNVFPRSVDATVAGVAAGLVSAGEINAELCGYRSKIIRLQFDDGRPDAIALVDVAATDSVFVGSRAVWDVESLRVLIACIAEPHCIGLSAIAAMLHPCDRREPGGVTVDFASDDQRVRAIVAPGVVVDIPFRASARVNFAEPISICGPTVLAFDGERDCELLDGVTATARVCPDGPFVIDPELVMAHAVTSGWFTKAGGAFDGC